MHLACTKQLDWPQNYAGYEPKATFDAPLPAFLAQEALAAHTSYVGFYNAAGVFLGLTGSSSARTFLKKLKPPYTGFSARWCGFGVATTNPTPVNVLYLVRLSISEDDFLDTPAYLRHLLAHYQSNRPVFDSRGLLAELHQQFAQEEEVQANDQRLRAIAHIQSRLTGQVRSNPYPASSEPHPQEPIRDVEPAGAALPS